MTSSNYGSPNFEFVSALKSILAKDRVFWAKDADPQSLEIIKEHSVDQSRYSSALPVSYFFFILNDFCY